MLSYSHFRDTGRQKNPNHNHSCLNQTKKSLTKQAWSTWQLSKCTNLCTVSKGKEHHGEITSPVHPNGAESPDPKGVATSQTPGAARKTCVSTAGHVKDKTLYKASGEKYWNMFVCSKRNLRGTFSQWSKTYSVPLHTWSKWEPYEKPRAAPFTGLGLVFTMSCSLLTLLCKTCMFNISNRPKLLFIFDQE